jgi:amidase
MAVERPTAADVSRLAEELGFSLSGVEADEFADLVDEALRSHDWLEQTAVPAADGASRPDSGRRPSPAENRLGAWYWKTDIRIVDDGPLAGKTVAVKDNIAVAGVPMMNGTAILEGYVPDLDATVVSRALAAGATIAGKAVCEALCYSGSSHTSDTGPVRNPYDPTRSSGGSSSGCGALLAAREVDLALGGDQGGSIRCPSSWSGVVGLKPTYGLVPYTGAFPLEMTLDHLGPMARTVADAALLLDVLAGADGRDPRQRDLPAPTGGGYVEALGLGVAGLRVGLLEEGFAHDVSEPDVDQAVRAAAESLEDLGARVVKVSVPWHHDAKNVSLGIAAEGSVALMIHGEGVGTNWRGLYATSMLEAFANGRRAQPDRLPAMVKLQAIVGQWMHETYRGRFYAKAQNLALELARGYDAALAEVDLLAVPTTPMKARPLPEGPLSATDSTHIAHEMGANTSPFNVSGHPAISVPCALSAGLPVGLMLVGPRGRDDLVLRAAHAFQTELYELPPPPLEVPVPDAAR